MNKLIFPILSALFVCLVFVTPVSAAGDSEVTEAKLQLNQEIRLLTHMQRLVERHQLARLFVLKKSAENVLESIDKFGISNMQTMRKYQELIVAYRFSLAFFQEIETEDTRDEIAQVLQLNDQISTARGFDDSPYTQLTGSVFNQMHQLVLQLSDNNTSVSPELKQKLSDLKAPLGQVIAVAKEGDRPKTFDAAIPVYRRIEALYPDFNLIMSSHSAFNLVLEIQGLNEFYAEYAQINR